MGRFLQPGFSDVEIQCFSTNDAAVHDSHTIDGLLDKQAYVNGNKRPVNADSAYRSKKREAELVKQNISGQICDKRSRGHPQGDKQKADTQQKSEVRSRAEHIFDAQAHVGGHWVRTIGLLRAKVKIGGDEFGIQHGASGASVQTRKRHCARNCMNYREYDGKTN